METYLDGIHLVSFVFQRLLAVLYLAAFINVLNQFPALLGERGILPAPGFLKFLSIRQLPTLFSLHYSDRFLKAAAWTGIFISAMLVTALSDLGPWWLPLVLWLVLYVLYLSVVNIGQRFYSFGWETMLLEAGFFAAFLGPVTMETPWIPLLILRWMLFRTELGAGLIKLRHDSCWRNFTCLIYHHETQPMPNPLSWYFHKFPQIVLKFGVLFSHFVQVIVPFALFLPQPFASIAGGFIIFHQLLLIIAGNYSWLNWLTLCLGFTALSDSALGWLIPFHLPAGAPVPFFYQMLMVGLAGGVIVLSYQPVKNLFMKNQIMNFSYNPFHLVGTYGAFGSISRRRYEVVIEGTDAKEVNEETRWQEYEFKGKPGRLGKCPPQFAPYHLRLDWLMWFLPFSVDVTEEKGVVVYNYDIWFLRFIQKLLEGDRAVRKLLESCPFPDHPPRFLRARYYLYEFTSADEKRKTGNWWKRRLIGDYLEAVSLPDLESLLEFKRFYWE